MRLKRPGITAIAVVAAMAFIGTSSAMAGETALCSVNQSPCEEGNLETTVHMVLASGTSLTFETSLVNVLCLGALAEASALAAGAPQAIDITSFAFTGCGTKAAHSNCSLTSTGTPYSAELLETAENLGSLVVTDEVAEVEVNCENIDIFGIDIECTYSFTGLSFHVEGATEGNNGMLNLEAAALEEVGSGSLCPEETEVPGGLLEPLAETYIAQGQGNPGIDITLPNPNPHLFTVNQQKTFTITNLRNNQVELQSEAIEGPFNVEGATCNTLKLNKNQTCTHRKVKCIAKGDGGFLVRAKDLGNNQVVRQVLPLHCH